MSVNEQEKDTAFDIVSQFDEELEAVNESLGDIDSLYSEVKEHFDRVKNSHARGSLSFVERQTSNLISLKTTRISLLKERINIKKAKADLYLKNKRMETGDDGGSNPALLRDIASMLISKDVSVNQIEDEYAGTVDGQVNGNAEEIVDSVDDLLESRIQELKMSGELELSDNEQAILVQKLRVSIVVVRKGKSWKYAAMDENGKFVKDYENLPDKKENPVKLQRDEEGNIIAVDNNDKIYKVINIKE